MGSRVRRLFSILLLMLFALPLLAPLLVFAGSALQDVELPVCCRRDGAHHCAMSMVARSQLAVQDALRDKEWSSPAQTCPFRTAMLLPAAGSLFRPEAPVASLFSAVLAHPRGIAQTQSRLCIARGRSRQKRGPPWFSLVQSIS